jgi:hypothetical protein
MATNGHLETLMTDLQEIQSQLETFGEEYLKLGSELGVLTLTLSTQPTEAYLLAKKNLDSAFMGLTSAMKSTSQQVKIAQQSVASAQSTSNDTTSGKTPPWLETWSDSWITFSNTLLTTHQRNLEKLNSLLKEKDL